MLPRNAGLSLLRSGRPALRCRSDRVWACRRRLTTASATRFAELVKKPSSRYQIYISNSHDPFINLSIEHYLLQSSHKDSTVLFLYVNRPCVVIGRNQNPWLETNLHHLRSASVGHEPDHSRQDGDHQVELVRRRSGGGTVFHDHGNVNYSVICPSAAFTRDKHAEMVVHAIRQANPRARVNERHDIVLDQGEPLLPALRQAGDIDHHTSGFEVGSFVKVSGSAYKLTRERALHHGTCLVNSPNVGGISRFLRSPASKYIKARGVDSVRSPVGNVYPESWMDAAEHFQRNTVRAFMYWHGIKAVDEQRLWSEPDASFIEQSEAGVVGRLDAGVVELDAISKGLAEMRSLDWIFTQTPQFTFSSHSTDDDPRPRPPLPAGLPQSTWVFFKVRNGAITESVISTSASAEDAVYEAQALDRILKGRKIHEIKTWREALTESSGVATVAGIVDLASWLDTMFGKTKSLERGI